MLKELASRVLALYSSVDARIADFAGAAQLSCPHGCGTCCLSQKVEATVLEMLPLAFSLFENGQAELLMKRIEKRGSDHQCIFFRSDFIEQGQYGCSQYPYRSLVCRMFAYAAIQNKHGKICFAPCAHMHLSEPVKADLPDFLPLAPIFSEFGMEITSLHPGLGTERMPINEAVLAALYKVGLFLECDAAQNELSGKGHDDPNDHPHDPSSPFHPPMPRAA